MVLTDIRLAMLNVLGSYTTSAWHNETKVLSKHSLGALFLDPPVHFLDFSGQLIGTPIVCTWQ